MVETQTIDIRQVQKILSSCPNYDDIVNYEYREGDLLSSYLIDWYRDLVFSANGEDERQLKIINLIDRSLALYIKDSRYKRGLKQVLSVEEVQNHSLMKEIIKKIISFTAYYEKREVFEGVNGKWI